MYWVTELHNIYPSFMMVTVSDKVIIENRLDRILSNPTHLTQGCSGNNQELFYSMCLACLWKQHHFCGRFTNRKTSCYNHPHSKLLTCWSFCLDVARHPRHSPCCCPQWYEEWKFNCHAWDLRPFFPSWNLNLTLLSEWCGDYQADISVIWTWRSEALSDGMS